MKSRAVSFALLISLFTIFVTHFKVNAQTFKMQNGATISVQNSGNIDLQNGTLSLTGNSKLNDSNGEVTNGQMKATRSINAPSGLDVGGLGAVITTSKDLGETVVTRGHTVQTAGISKTIKRYYEINPTNNSSLDATLKFNYENDEVNGLSESDFILFRSDDSGSTYSTAGYDNRNASTNTITLNGISSFSRFTVTTPDLYNSSSLTLNGTDQFVDLSSVADDLSGASTMTVEFWVKPDFTNQTNPDGVALFGLNDINGNDLVHIFAGDNRSQDQKVRVFDGSDDSFEITGPALSDAKWHHIAYRIDSGTGTLFVDGNQAGQHPLSLSLSSDDQWSIGQQYDGGTKADFTDGVIDKVQVWSSALSQDNIQKNTFQPLEGDESGLAAYWPLNSSSDDFSNNSNSASLINSPSFGTAKHPTGTFISGSEGWRMMAAPTGGKTYSQLLEELWTQGIPGSDSPTVGTPNVLKWDEPNQQFVAVDGTKQPSPGQGFIVYVYNDQDYDGTGEGFPKMLNTDASDRTANVSPSLSFTSGGVADSTGWNMAANPYGSTINWSAPGWTKSNLDASVYVWDNSANNYKSHNGSSGTLTDGKIAPWQGFWVKATSGSAKLEITNKVRDAGGELYKQDSKPASRLKLFLEKSDNRQSATVLHFDDRAKLQKDPLDAWQLDPLSTKYLSLYTTNPQTKAFDINAIPTDTYALDGKVLEIPVYFKDSHPGGQYRFSWDTQALPDGWGITLKDTHTGKIVGLQKNEQYKFDVAGNPDQQSTKETKAMGDGQRNRALSVPQLITMQKTSKDNQMKNKRFVLKINPNGKKQQRSSIPEDIQLDDNYPNPFNPTTVIRYGVPEQSDVQLNVYNILGQQVRTLVNEQQSAGRYEINFDGSGLASGTYIYRLNIGSQTLTKKMTLIK